jgi:hypothetical protein
MAITRRSAWSPDTLDRALVGVCVVIWLAFIGVSVAATVVLVHMGTGGHSQDTTSHTPWPLYLVIGVSAVIIVGAIPLLVRARRTALGESTRGPAKMPAPVRRPAGGAAGAPLPGTEVPTEKLRVFGSIADPIERGSASFRAPESRRRLAGGLSEEIVDRLWLRATAVIAGAIGAAMLAVAAATYLMGVDKDDPAWAAYGVAAVITVAMPVIPWLYLRQLRGTIAARLR